MRILQINPEFCDVFINKPIIAFKKSKIIQDLIDGNIIKDGKVANKKLEKRQGKSKRHVIQRDQLYDVCKW